ncbi:HGxxPAAW family protein [Streptomyces sp. NPDC088789]|uniref:HGxxPAAW family protein n=1 Tax=Streptomyces sp. NPDC088789 TaxID=3365899 RepID=UPI00382DB214
MSAYDEGHTVAGWTGVGIGSVGSAIAGVGVCMTSPGIGLAGVGVVAAGVLVTWVLHLAGWGKPPGPRPREEWGLGVRDSGARDGHAGCWGCRLAGRGRGRGREPGGWREPGGLGGPRPAGGGSEGVGVASEVVVESSSG